MQNESKQSKQPVGLSRLFTSVAAKFTFGIFTWFVIAAAVNILGLIYLTTFQSSLTALTEKTLPNADSSAKLAVVTTSLAGKVRQFALVDKQVQRRIVLSEIQADLNRIDELRPQLQDLPDFETFESVLTIITQSITRLNGLIENRLGLSAQKEEITTNLAELMGNEFLTISDVKSEDQMNVLLWQNKISSILTKAIESTNIDKLRDTRLLRRQLQSDIRGIQQLYQSLPDDIAKKLKEKEQVLSYILFDTDGYLDSLVDMLRMTVRVHGVENQVLTLNEEISKLSEAIFQQATDQVANDAGVVNGGIESQINYTMLAALILLFSTILFAFFMRKTIVLRLKNLNKEVTTYSHSGSEDITVEGNDEIADISHSIRDFIDEIEGQQRALIEAKLKAESATKSKSEFLATMSHEIRTPMNGVVSMTEMLTKTNLDAQQKEFATIAQQSASSLLTIINDILDFSRIEAGKLEIERSDFNLYDLVSGVSALCGADAYSKGLELYFDIAPDVPRWLKGDPTRIRQILLNLASNAVKFTERGSITINLTWEDKAQNGIVHFEVIDTGLGINKGAIKRLFRAFEQADGSTVRRFGGSGLGLSICKRLVELMNGDIGAESEEGTGSRFYFSIPLKKAKSPSEAVEKTTDRIGILFLFTNNAKTQELLFKHLKSSIGRIDVLNIHDMNSWKESVQNISKDERHFLLVDHNAVTSTDQALALKQTFNRPNITTAMMVPRVQFTIIEETRWDWVKNTIAKPVYFNALPAILNELETGTPVDKSEGATTEESDYANTYCRQTAEESKEIILVAEDNIMNQKIIARVFDKFGIYYDIVDNGEEALDVITRGYFAAVLTDFHMPKMDGLMLTKAIKAHDDKAIKDLPVIMLTADAQKEAEELCREAGADGFLAKPIVFDDLEAEFRKWLPNSDVWDHYKG